MRRRDNQLLQLRTGFICLKNVASLRVALVRRNLAEYKDIKIDEVDSGDCIVAPAEKKSEDSAVVVNMLNEATNCADLAIISREGGV